MLCFFVLFITCVLQYLETSPFLPNVLQLLEFKASNNWQQILTWRNCSWKQIQGLHYSKTLFNVKDWCTLNLFHWQFKIFFTRVILWSAISIKIMYIIPITYVHYGLQLCVLWSPNLCIAWYNSVHNATW